jgi:signal peptidase
VANSFGGTGTREAIDEMNPILRRALKLSSSLMIGLVVLLAILLFGLRFVGLTPYTVLSPSMEPKYPTGSLIYLVKVDPDELQVKDVITFRLGGGTTATHRIIELVADEQDPTHIRFRTKGDNNDTPDGSLVEKDAVVGKAVLCIPYLGYLAQYMQKPPGSYTVIAIGLAMIAYTIVVDMVTETKKEKIQEEGDVQNETA